MDDGERVLSDVHMDKIVVGLSEDLQMTRFKFRTRLPEQETLGPPSYVVEVDDDGDFVKPSSETRDYDVIRIFHRMSTGLSSVGLQVWRGALLACDYIVHNRSRFAGKHVLELGSGTGLAAIVAAEFASRVTCTDVGDDVIRLCRKNVEENRGHLGADCSVSVQTLDWFSEFDVADSPQIFLIADCVYDNQLTEALFRSLFRLVTARSCVDDDKSLVVFALEKRLNFTLEDYDVTCREYDHFRTCLGELLSRDGFSANQICVDSLPQYFEYDRTKYVEIWEIYYHLKL